MNTNRDKLGRYKHTGETHSNYWYGSVGHRKIWEKHYGKIPKGMVIHHINRDKFDNRIENLQLMTVTEHNRLHSHTAWNKGKAWKKETLNKIHANRHITMLNRWKAWSEMHDAGMTYVQIAKELGYARESISRGVKLYKKELNG